MGPGSQEPWACAVWHGERLQPRWIKIEGQHSLLPPSMSEEVIRVRRLDFVVCVGISWCVSRGRFRTSSEASWGPLGFFYQFLGGLLGTPSGVTE